MRRIFINSFVENIAHQYAKDVLLLNREPILNDLIALLKKKRLRDYARYVEEVKNNYKDLLICIPDKTSPLIPAVPPVFNFSYSISTTVKKNGSGQRKNKKRKFYELLMEAMGYNEIRNHIYPKYVKELGIKTCVYCNAQYGATIQKVNGAYTSSYEIDHFLPKNRYPCFSVSFFNFQPSCSHCNGLKGQRDAMFNLYTKDYKELNPFFFSIDRKSLLKYLVSLNDTALRINLECSSEPLRLNHLHLFHINEKYANHNDEVAKLILKYRFYNDAYLSQLRGVFDKIFSRSPYPFDEIFLGFPLKPNEIHKKPLSLLIQSICKDLGILSR